VGVNTHACRKLTTKGAAGIVQIGDKGGRLFVAEGPETAASIAMVEKGATVLTSMGVYNLLHIANVIKKFNPSEVIIAADNDGDAKNNTADTTINACNKLQENGFKASIVTPKMINGLSKTDWNDVLKRDGAESVKLQIQHGRLESFTKKPQIVQQHSSITTTLSTVNSNLNRALNAVNQDIIRKSIASPAIENTNSIDIEMSKEYESKVKDIRVKNIEKELEI